MVRQRYPLSPFERLHDSLCVLCDLCGCGSSHPFTHTRMPILTAKEMLVKTLFAMTALAILTSCVNPGVPIKMYGGDPKPNTEIVTLLPPPSTVGFVVLEVDNAKTSSCAVSCMFYGPVQILPGKHNFGSSNVKTQASNHDDLSKVVPDNAHEAVTEDQKIVAALVSDSYSFNFDDNLVAGKSYRLMLAHKKKDDEKVALYVWWQEVNDK